jgi:2-keto-4-pentenoate hydratase/2-oxohepta-3-ene-1,7-dioic acid hydratase in catechol pathway
VRVLRVGPPGAERAAVLAEDGSLLDAGALVPAVDGAWLAAGGLADLAGAVARGALPPLAGDPASRRVGAPVARPGKVVCIGLNYRDHAAETSAAVPSEPVVFLKDPWTVQGPDDGVLLPRGSVKTDYEVELAVVIGRVARYVASDEEAMACVAGYAVADDLSEREFQLERPGGQWDKGKSCETFNPLGPWLVTPEEVPDPQALAVSLAVNGQVRQSSSTAQMVFGVAELVRHLSGVMVLHPGDVINTGTPAGVALGQPDPKPYLRAGDVVEATIAGLGTMRHEVGQA